MAGLGAQLRHLACQELENDVLSQLSAIHSPLGHGSSCLSVTSESLHPSASSAQQGDLTSALAEFCSVCICTACTVRSEDSHAIREWLCKDSQVSVDVCRTDGWKSA
jgi:hypothetical protein